jgi:hypothetical protein
MGGAGEGTIADHSFRRRRPWHVLFILACGLSVTLGLMNFVNLAHGAFGMAGAMRRRF